MWPHTRILYSLCDRITGEARGARQKDTGSNSNQARGLCRTGVPNARLWRVGVEDIKGRALDWLDPAGVAASKDAPYENVRVSAPAGSVGWRSP